MYAVQNIYCGIVVDTFIYFFYFVINHNIDLIIKCQYFFIFFEYFDIFLCFSNLYP